MRTPRLALIMLDGYRGGNGCLMDAPAGWPQLLPVTHVRIARPTNQLEDVVRFYGAGLGLRILGRFRDHEGYDGVMIGLPDRKYHLEFTSLRDRAALLPPSPDSLLVLYVRDQQAIHAQVRRLASMGYHVVPPLNPYWERRGVTIPDPDGWRVVLAQLGSG